MTFKPADKLCIFLFCITSNWALAFIGGLAASKLSEVELKYNTISQLANRTVLCELLGGTCILKDVCEILKVRDLLDNTPYKDSPDLTCDEDLLCCFAANNVDSKVNQDTTTTNAQKISTTQKSLSEEDDKLNIEEAISKVNNKTLLCDVLRGTCMSQDMCDILKVKSIIENKNPPDRSEFMCEEKQVCCFANLTSNSETKPKTDPPGRQIPPLTGATPISPNFRSLVNSLVTGRLLDTVRGRLSNAALGDRPVRPYRTQERLRTLQPRILPRRIPTLRSSLQRRNFDYNYYNDYQPNFYYDDYYANDYYDYPVNRRRGTSFRRNSLFEPLGRIYKRPRGRTRTSSSLQARARAGYGKPASTRTRGQSGYELKRSYPKVTEKYEYHDHTGHGHSLISDGLDQVLARGFDDVFVSNLSAFCEIYDGVCVEPGDCATVSGRSYSRFQCNTTTICCLPDYSVKRLHPLGHQSHHSQQAKKLLLSHLSPEGSDLFTQTDREALCALKNGTCIHPSLCISHHDDYDDHHHGYSNHGDHGEGYHDTYNLNKDFYCNLTSICCTPSLFDVFTHVQVISGYKNKG